MFCVCISQTNETSIIIRLANIPSPIRNIKQNIICNKLPIKQMKTPKLQLNYENTLTNLNLTDMETCYKMWKSDIIKNVELRENRFGFEPEVTARIARIPNIRIYEVGISYYGRTYAEGKKISWKDGFRAIYCIMKYNIWARQMVQV